MRRLISVVTWLPQYLIVRPVKGCLRKGFGCLFLFALLSVLMVGLLWATLREVGAEEPGAEPLAVYLLVDNSNSMWEMNGVGSDPHMLRIDAARLFISYLGVDDSRVAHQCAVVFFGGDAELVAPLARLTDEERRSAMLELIQQPPRMGWTDQAEALALAQDDLMASGTAARPAIVLLTDGKPEWGYEPTQAQREAYIERLRAEGEQLADAGIPLFIILLANEATDADSEIANVWQPLWEEMATRTAPGRFYTARQAEDLADIYHDVVVALSGSRTSGAVLEGEVGAGGMRRTVAVEPNLARLTLVASKSRPDLSVTVLLPDGTPLSTGQPGVRYAGEPGATREEIWVIDEPIPGDWTVLVSGEGRVTVWKDYRPAPAPSPTSTLTPTPTDTPVPSPTATPMPSPTPTATPFVLTRDEPRRVSMAREPQVVKTETSGMHWVWGLGGLAAVAVVAVVFYRRRQQQLLVEGDLHIVGGQFDNGERMVELDLLQQAQLTVGAAPADVIVTGAEHRFTLQPGALLGDSREMLISGPPEVRHNDRPLGETARPLDDGDSIRIGDTELRYENLRLRSANHALTLEI
ncbi:MAG: VWA domain-containing protein [Chloroflexota bacterium]